MNLVVERQSVGLRELWITVDVEPGFELADVVAEDREALGSYCCSVPEELADPLAAALAMGLFHTRVPVENLGTLSFEVSDSEGAELVPTRDADWYGLAAQYGGTLHPLRVGTAE